MVHIVTGTVNSGKTTKLLSLYKELKTGDGFILPKVYIDGTYIGQQVVRLSTGAGKPFSFKEGYIPAYWNEKYRYDIYSFSREGFDYVFNIADDIIQNNISPVFIDEIGPLELQGKGFSEILSQFLLLNSTIYISIRETLLKSVIERFNIKSYDLIKVG